MNLVFTPFHLLGNKFSTWRYLLAERRFEHVLPLSYSLITQFTFINSSTYCRIRIQSMNVVSKHVTTIARLFCVFNNSICKIITRIEGLSTSRYLSMLYHDAMFFNLFSIIKSSTYCVMLIYVCQSGIQTRFNWAIICSVCSITNKIGHRIN